MPTLPNPWLLLGIVAIWLASLVGVGYWQHGAGAAAKALDDQHQFDKINHDLTEQKTTAAGLLADAHAANALLQADRDSLKTQLEKDHVQAQAVTNDLRSQLAGVKLQFRAVAGTGCGQGGGGASGGGSDTAGDAGTAVVQIPEKIAGDLRQLAFDDDTVKDDYRTLYRWAHSDAVRCSLHRGAP